MPAPLLLFTLQITVIMAAMLLACGSLKTQPGKPAGRVFALGVSCVALYILDGMTGAHVDPMFRLDLGRSWHLIHPAVQAIPGLFMIYSFLEFQESNRFPVPLLLLFVIQVLFETVLGIFGPGYEGSAVSQIAFILNILQLIFVGFALYWTVKGWRADLVEDRRILRWIGISMQGILLYFVLIVENYMVVNGLMSPAKAQLLIVGAIALLLTVILLTTVKFDFISLEQVIQKATVLTDGRIADRFEELNLDNFNQRFEEGKLYREAGLTIADLAKQLQVPEYRLRQFIHKTLGFSNFNAMLHHYRIREATEFLADPRNSNMSVLSVALAVGYQSITPFNKAFRRIMGVTPSDYRTSIDRIEK